MGLFMEYLPRLLDQRVINVYIDLYDDLRE